MAMKTAFKKGQKLGQVAEDVFDDGCVEINKVIVGHGYPREVRHLRRKIPVVEALNYFVVQRRVLPV